MTPRKVNCLSSFIQTPPSKIKKPPASSTNTPEKFEERTRTSSPRSSLPTAAQMECLLAMRKCHTFLHHRQIKYSQLEKIGLETSCVTEIHNFLGQNRPEVPDIVYKQEMEGAKTGEFCNEVKEYIAEEFKILTEYSFLTLCILTFCHENKMSVTESANDLLVYSSTRFVCDDCANVSSEVISGNLLEDHNLKVLRDLFHQSALDESKDNSDDDRDYIPVTSSEPISDSDSSDLSQDVYSFTASADEDNSDFEICNPAVEKKTKLVNSTMLSKSKHSESLFPADPSPIKAVQKPGKACDRCGKEFSKRYNLKQHLISVHKVFPKGSVIFECPVPTCTFASGSKLLFSRHSHKKGSSVPSKLICTLCSSKFATKGSLMRHVGGKHKN